MNRITINGQTFSVSSSNVSIVNGVVIVGGDTIISGLEGEGSVHITWEGDLASLKTDASVTCQNVLGNVEAGGSVRCNDVEGSVNCGGSLRATGHIGKSINAGGSVRIN